MHNSSCCQASDKHRVDQCNQQQARTPTPRTTRLAWAVYGKRSSNPPLKVVNQDDQKNCYRSEHLPAFPSESRLRKIFIKKQEQSEKDEISTWQLTKIGRNATLVLGPVFALELYQFSEQQQHSLCSLRLVDCFRFGVHLVGESLLPPSPGHG